MKRIGGLWAEVWPFECLLRAYHIARVGKWLRPAVAAFALNLEEQLLSLSQALHAETWQPGKFRQFTVYEGKPRLISAAPFSDRVVHHALVAKMGPEIDRRLVFDCYACRAGKGVHAAVDRYQQFAKRYAYVLHLDIRRYFPSVRHDVLKCQLSRVFREQPLLSITARIIDSYCHAETGAGLPIGNLTSQWFANLYLSGVDHFVKENLKIPGYLRYVDDLILFSDSRLELERAALALADPLCRLGLSLHEQTLHIRRTDEKCPVFGYQISRQRRWLAASNARRFRRRLSQLGENYAKGRVSLASVSSAVAGWVGHAKHGETDGLRTKLFSGVRFSRVVGESCV